MICPISEDIIQNTSCTKQASMICLISEDTIQNTSCTTAGFNDMSDIDSDMFNNP